MVISPIIRIPRNSSPIAALMQVKVEQFFLLSIHVGPDTIEKKRLSFPAYRERALRSEKVLLPNIIQGSGRIYIHTWVNPKFVVFPQWPQTESFSK